MMVLDSKQTTVAYRCPHCGGGVISIVGLFTLSADMVKLKCPCGKSEMSIVYTNDKKIRLNVPCIICPKPHNFVLSPSVFFDKEMFTLSCPYSGVEVCFIGDENHVKAELARSELALLDMLEENGIESFESLHKESEKVFTDPQIYDIIMFVIHDLDEAGAIRCSCGEHNTDNEYEVEVLESCIRVRCTKCHDYVDIPTDTLIRAYDFLNTDSLTLHPDTEDRGGSAE